MDTGRGRRNKQFAINEFNGLSTTFDSKENLKSASEALNVSYEIDGSISKREGSKTFISDAGVKDNFLIRSIDRIKTSIKDIEGDWIPDERAVNNYELFPFEDKKYVSAIKVDKSSATTSFFDGSQIDSFDNSKLILIKGSLFYNVEKDDFEKHFIDSTTGESQSFEMSWIDESGNGISEDKTKLRNVAKYIYDQRRVKTNSSFDLIISDNLLHPFVLEKEILQNTPASGYEIERIKYHIYDKDLKEAYPDNKILEIFKIEVNDNGDIWIMNGKAKYSSHETYGKVSTLVDYIDRVFIKDGQYQFERIETTLKSLMPGGETRINKIEDFTIINGTVKALITKSNEINISNVYTNDIYHLPSEISNRQINLFLTFQSDDYFKSTVGSIDSDLLLTTVRTAEGMVKIENDGTNFIIIPIVNSNWQTDDKRLMFISNESSPIKFKVNGQDFSFSKVKQADNEYFFRTDDWEKAHTSSLEYLKMTIKTNSFHAWLGAHDPKYSFDELANPLKIKEFLNKDFSNRTIISIDKDSRTLYMISKREDLWKEKRGVFFLECRQNSLEFNDPIKIRELTNFNFQSDINKENIKVTFLNTWGAEVFSKIIPTTDENVVISIPYTINNPGGTQMNEEDTKIRYITTNSNQNILSKIQIKQWVNPNANTLHLKEKVLESEIIGKDKLVIFTEGKNISFRLLKDTGEISPDKIISSSAVSDNFSFGDGEYMIDWTYINNMIIITTNKDIYIIALIESSDSSPRTYIFIDKLYNMSEGTTYDEITYYGLNILSEHPLEIKKSDADLTGFNFGIQDIMINEKGTDDIAIKIIPNKEYNVFANVGLPKLPASHTHKRNSIEYKWTLNKLGVDGVWTTIPFKDAFKKVDGTSFQDADNDKFIANIPEIILNPIKHNGELQIQLDVKWDDEGTIKESSKIISFIPSNETVEDKNVFKKSLIDEIKDCKYVTSFDGRLVLYGNGTQQIYTSLPDKPFYFTSREITKADAWGKGEDIVAIEIFKDTKVVFTNSTMMSMTRQTIEGLGSFWSILPLDGAVGCVGHWATTPIENTLAFTDRNGIFIIKQISVAEHRVELEKISSIINDIALPYEDIVEKNDEKLMDDIQMSNIEHRVFISYPQKDIVLVYDYIGQTGKWSTWNGYIPTRYVIDDNILYFTAKNDGGSKREFIYKKNPRITRGINEIKIDENFFKDVNDKYEWSYITKGSSLGNNYVNKKMKRIIIEATNPFIGVNSFDVMTFTDGRRDQSFSFSSDKNKKALLDFYTSDNIKLQENKHTVTNSSEFGKETFTGVGSSGFVSGSLGFKDKNIYSKIFMVSNNGKELSVKLSNKNTKPINIKSILVEYTESKVKGSRVR